MKILFSIILVLLSIFIIETQFIFAMLSLGVALFLIKNEVKEAWDLLNHN